MLKNYLLIAWRSLLNNKTYSFINISGLALGLAACMLIILYAGHEWSYDRFHKNANRIYWVQAKLKLGSDSVYMPYLNYSMAPALKNNTPSIESFLRLKQPDREVVVQNSVAPSVKFTENKFLFADSNFFDFFSFRLQAGNKEQVLQHPFSVVLSPSAAIKYFGKENPIGKTIRYNHAYDFMVTGVAEETPSNSSIVYDFIAPVSSLLSMKEQRDLVQNEEPVFSTYFLVQPTAAAAQLEAGLQQLDNTKNQSGNLESRYMALPLKSMHTFADTDKSNTKYLKLFPLVAGIILILAIFNYISLTTARSSVRLKEIGVRKVLGANRKNLTVQFFLESALYTTIAFALGYLLCLLFQPFFFRFLQLTLDDSFLYRPLVLSTYALLYVLTVLLSALYPSLLLSAFRPATVLYGKLGRQSGGLSIRKFVTVFQFTISVVLLTSALIIQRQLHFIRHADTGIHRDQVLMIPFSPGVGKSYTAFKKEVQSLSAVQEVSVALHRLYKGYDMMGVTPKHANQMILLPTLMVDQHFISLLKLKWKTPPPYSLLSTHRKEVAVVNETAVERLNLGPQPIHQKIDNRFEIAGVLKDFNYSSLQNKIEPLCLFVVPDSDTSALWAHQGGCLYAKTTDKANVSLLIEQLKSIYERYDREKPFEASFMDEAFEAQYKAEDRLSKILHAFTAFAVLIASLGLFGLAAFMALRRTKEIGIRKVLGASVQSITLLLSKEFITLVALAIVIALPIAWWAVNSWLQNFAYRINMEWWMFAAAGLFVLVLALLTVSLQSIKAAIANPAKSLKNE
jgi:putative ABC transport system permease protein